MHHDRDIGGLKLKGREYERKLAVSISHLLKRMVMLEKKIQLLGGSHGQYLLPFVVLKPSSCESRVANVQDVDRGVEPWSSRW